MDGGGKGRRVEEQGQRRKGRRGQEGVGKGEGLHLEDLGRCKADKGGEERSVDQDPRDPAVAKDESIVSIATPAHVHAALGLNRGALRPSVASRAALTLCVCVCVCVSVPPSVDGNLAHKVLY